MQLSSVSVDEKRKQGTFAKRDIKEFNLINDIIKFFHHVPLIRMLYHMKCNSFQF